MPLVIRTQTKPKNITLTLSKTAVEQDQQLSMIAQRF